MLGIWREGRDRVGHSKEDTPCSLGLQVGAGERGVSRAKPWERWGLRRIR